MSDYDVPLPPGFEQEQESDNEEKQDSAKVKPNDVKKLYGPTRPPTAEENEKARKLLDQDEESDDEVVGPKILSPEEIAYRERLNEERTQEWEQDEWKRIREDKGPDSKPKQRDSWMTSIPEGRGAYSALAPRQFSRKGVGPTKIDESWMASPLDKGKPKKGEDLESLKEELELARQKEVDKLLQEQNKQRGPSLLEMHQQKRKPVEDSYKPFDRERDLSSSQIDPKKRQKMIQQAKKLDTMFEKGGGY